MLKTLYYKYKYFFNMLAVLVLVMIVRILDWLAWIPSSPGKIQMILFEHLFQFISFLLIIIMLIYSYRWAMKSKKKYLLYTVVVLYALFGPIFFLYLVTWLELFFRMKGVLPIDFNMLAKYSPPASLVIMFLSSAFYLTHLVQQSAKQRETAHKAENLAKDVQLKMLRYQINPHFLFNVLNSIYTLIDENTEKAKKLVIDMSEYFRYTLNKEQQTTTTIEKEVESIIKYLEIQKTRFEEEFHYEVSVAEEVKSLLIPSFIIHLLIENAVKYGTKTMKGKLIISLSVKKVNKMLFIKVANTGKLLNGSPDGKKNDGTGNGIDNLKFRMALYYNDNYSFSLKEEDGWVIAVTEINNINTQ